MRISVDAVLLAKIQFGFTAGFHFLFPPTTLGLTFIILIIESLYLKTNEELYKNISSFLIKILSVVFVMGVATGIVLEFAFGNNWAEFSRMVGDIFGAPLAAEGIFAFFLESVFLGILVFGRSRISKRAYWWSAFFVFFGSHLSGIWIIIANSWMQTPAGYKIEGDEPCSRISLRQLSILLQSSVTSTPLLEDGSLDPLLPLASLPGIF
jgi:cytochrome d ubiquinol oxidase subunit I